MEPLSSTPSTEPVIRPPPSEQRPEDKRFLRLPHAAVLPRPPFSAQIVARIGGGKSSLLYSILADLYARYWDEVVIWCASMDSKSAWEALEPKKQRSITLLHEMDEASLEEYVKQLQKDQAERLEKGKQPLRICLVFDDMQGRGVTSRARATALEKVVLVCRHELNATVIMCSQSYRDNSPTLRANTLHYFFAPLAQLDQAKVAAEHSNHVDPSTFMRMMSWVHSQPQGHRYLQVDYRAPEHARFKHGFSRVLNPAFFAATPQRALKDVERPAAAAEPGSGHQT